MQSSLIVVALKWEVMGKSIEIEIDPEVFDSFGLWSGWVPAGFWANWLGVLTRSYVWAFPQELLDVYSKRRYEEFRYPINDEHVLDWVPLLEAVLAAGKTFVMVALGCGWGRWLSGGAFAAKKTEKEYRLVGAEAEPEHFKWLEIHLKENGIDLSRCRLINGAAAGYNGQCWFYVGKPSSWYGQSIIPEKTIHSAQSQQIDLDSEMEYDGERVKCVRCFDLKEIIGKLSVIDYLHMDVQGAEYEILSAHPGFLNQRVKMVNVGTHSIDIENQLRNLFSELGWEKRYDITLDSQISLRLGAKETTTVKFGDGVQVWRNPALFK